MSRPFREYQQRMIDEGLRMYRDPNVLGHMLGADMGLGKTLAFSEIVDRLMNDLFIADKVLIAAPKRVAYETIPNEFKKWGYKRLERDVWAIRTDEFELKVGKARVLQASDTAIKLIRYQMKSTPRFIHLVSQDMLHHYLRAAGPSFTWDLVILDESTSYSNPRALRFKAARKIIKRSKKVLLSTGTPFPDKAEQIAGQMWLIDRGERLGSTLTAFREEFMTPDLIMDGEIRSWKLRRGALKRISKKIADRITVLRSEDWLELPERIENWITVKMPASAREQYDAFEKKGVLYLDGDGIFGVNAGVIHGKLQQMANGMVYLSDPNNHLNYKNIHDAKLDALIELCENHPGPLIIWYSHTHDRNRILRRIKGSTWTGKVKNLEEEWNAGKIHRLLAHPGSIGHGMNLQNCEGADEVWYGFPTRNEHFRQGLKRLHRSGRNGRLVSHRIICEDTVEDAIVERLDDKQDLESAVKEALALRRKKWMNSL